MIANIMNPSEGCVLFINIMFCLLIFFFYNVQLTEEKKESNSGHLDNVLTVSE